MRALLAGLTLLAAGCAASSTEDGAQQTADLTALPACLPTLACAAPADPSVARAAWRHPFQTPAFVLVDPITLLPRAPNHRGRDVFVNPGAPQTIIAHFTYGLVNADLEDEDVEIFVQRECGQGWESLGTATTTSGSAPHADLEGITDEGGHVFFEVPEARRLGPGRHRVRLVVKGDGSSTELFMDVVPPGTPVFVSDVDGTLTSFEHVEYAALLVGATPGTHVGAPEALRTLAAKGYRPFYLTARPEWLTQRTREFLEERGYPPGIIHTTTSFLGASSQGGAAAFKTAELAMLKAKGLVPTYGFGNKTTDAEAYATAIPEPQNRVFYRLDAAFEGRGIQSYEELLPAFSSHARVCAP